MLAAIPEKLFLFVAPAVIVLSQFSIQVERFRERAGEFQFNLNVSLGELLLFASSPLLLLTAWNRRHTLHSSSLLERTLLVLAISASLVLNGNYLQGGLEGIRWALLLFCGHFLFAGALGTEKRLVGSLGILESTLLVAAAGNLAVAVFQKHVLEADPYLIRGFFRNSHVLGGFLILAFPIFASKIAKWGTRTAHGLGIALTCVAGSVLTYHWAFLAMAVMLAASAALGNSQAQKRLSLSLLVTLLLSFSFQQVHEFRSAREKYAPNPIGFEYARIRALIDSHQSGAWGAGDTGGYLAVKFTAWRESGKKVPAGVNPFREYAFYKNESISVLRLAFGLAALNMASSNPVYGVGWGNYQRKIGEYFGGVPKVNLLEPDSESTPILVYSSAGLAGLLAFANLFRRSFKEHLRKGRDLIENPSLFSLVGIAFYSLFFPVVAGSFAVFLVLLVSLSDSEPKQADKS